MLVLALALVPLPGPLPAKYLVLPVVSSNKILNVRPVSSLAWAPLSIRFSKNEVVSEHLWSLDVDLW